MARPDGSGLTIRKGTNDLYIYMQVGRENDPRGNGIGALFVPPNVTFTPPATRRPRGPIVFTPKTSAPGTEEWGRHSDWGARPSDSGAARCKPLIIQQVISWIGAC